MSSARGAAIAALTEHDRFVLVTHEHPDGDALGSLTALTRVLRARGADVVPVLARDDVPVPREYARIQPEGVAHEPPADIAERVAVFLDCGNAERNAVAGIAEGAALVLNVDHHHDNTCFGTVDLVDPDASSTAEIVWDLTADLGVPLDPVTAEALYVALVTDTGRFMYANTGPRAHRMAADLVAAGVDVHAVYRRLYEDVPWAKLDLLGRALERAQIHVDGRLVLSFLRRADFVASGAEDSLTEGIVDYLRTVEGAKVAAVARELDDERRTKVSLRATDGDVDVSVIARAGGGGGHPQAAGLTTDLPEDELVAFLVAQVAAQR